MSRPKPPEPTEMVNARIPIRCKKWLRKQAPTISEALREVLEKAIKADKRRKARGK